MNNSQDSTQANASVVTFSNIPLDDEPVAIGFDSIPPEALEPQDVTVIGVQFKKGGKVYYFDPCGLDIAAGTEVIIDTARGYEYGYCAEANHAVPPSKVVQPLRQVIRIATDSDKRTRAEYKNREAEAFAMCQDKIIAHQLDMKLVSAEYSFDGSKILFYFTADGRVDFRELVKDLAGVFRTRIELRQIGVRDEAKLMGGLGICGRPFCCKQFLDDFQPVSIKMAKTQSLSLNPTKISGTCGRLMCCLKYEQDAYEDLIRSCPKQDSIVNTCDGRGTVTEVNLLKESVKVRLDSDPSSIKTYCNCDICVLRNGKGKKTDPPIPDNIPPLPKPAAKAEEAPVSDTDYLSRYASDSTRSSGFSGASGTSGAADTSRTSGFSGGSRSGSSRRDSSRQSSGERRRRDNDSRGAAQKSAEAADAGAQNPQAAANSQNTQNVQNTQNTQGGQSRRHGQKSGRRGDRKQRNDGENAAPSGERSEKQQRIERAPRNEKAQRRDSERISVPEGSGEQAAKSSDKPRSRNNRRHYYRGRKSGGGKTGQSE